MSLRVSFAVAVLGAAILVVAPGIGAQQPVPSTLQSTVAGSPDSLQRVTTALGIERDRRSLGVAQQTVRGDSITAAGETNIVSALAGRVAGADVSGTGASGTSVRLLLRGARTGAENDQPLFVVDGVPVANATISGNATDSPIDYGSTLADIDPNDIASITVLDGPNAAALYGSRAQNGAVLITTKSAAGTRGFSLTARQDYTFESPQRLPQFQARYALGDEGVYRAAGLAAFGPAVYGTDQVQWWSGGQPALLVAQPDNLRDFLVQGHTSTTTAAVSGASSRGDVRLGITNVDQGGLQPNSRLSRLGTSLSAGMEVLPRLRIRVDGQYVHAEANQQPVQGLSTDDAVAAFIFTGSAIDVGHLRTDAMTNHADEFAAGFGFNNPYWDAGVNSNANVRDHAIGVVSADYGFFPWMRASIRTGIDWWHDRESQTDPDVPVQVMPDGFSVAGGTTYREQNSDFLVSVAHSLGAAVDMSVDAGVATRGGRTSQRATVSDDFGRIAAVTDESIRVKTNSAYGRASFSFDSTLFLDATGRKDWLVERPAFSPSLSAAYDIAHHTPNGWLGGIVSAAKLRASWAQVAAETDFTTLDRTTSWEEGADLGFLRDRLLLSATYYDERTLTRSAILTLFGPPAEQSFVTTDRGVELSLGIKALAQTNGLQWDLGLRVAANRSRVQGPASVRGIDGIGAPALLAGQPYGTIVAYAPERDSLGRMILEDGLPLDTLSKLGSELPSWVGGLESDLRFKQFSLMLLVDSRHGGHVYSNTNRWGTSFGTLASTVAIRQHVADGAGVVIPGVNRDGTPNTTPIAPEVYYEEFAADANFAVFDASAVELSEVRVGYSVQPSLVARLHLTTLEIAAIGRTLLVHSNAPNFDPQSVFDTGAGQGVETFGVPSARSVGLTLTVVP
ncbi:MAG TPA: TonB-dependent receptor plug domain-containing protein [Gemmatimonadaceae bacterium]|nr:TonB-dependent receptor plug domain-containing protein [Gemmatimonadaceae bacterium]